jgi:colicin import membrane protein
MSARGGIKVLLGIFATAWAACAFAQPLPGQVREKLTDRFPPGSIRSVEHADGALSEAAVERAEIEARYLAEEQACHPDFFTTSCIQKAKERRRIALSALRPIELEANAFKRKARVTERDQALAERLEKDEKQRLERAGRVTASEGEAVDSSSNVSAEKSQTANSPVPEKQPAPKAPRQKTENRLSVEQRAANVAAYEKKRREAVERQQKVAQRKAEKEQKRKSKQAENKRPV